MLDALEKELRRLMMEEKRRGAVDACKKLRRISHQVQNDIVAETISDIVTR